MRTWFKNRWASRNGKVALLSLAAMLIAGVAWAIIVHSFSIEGGPFSVTVDAEVEIVYTASGPTAECNAVGTATGYEITSWPAFPATCQVRFDITSITGNSDAFLSDFVVADSRMVVTSADCNTQITDGGQFFVAHTFNPPPQAGTYTWQADPGDILVFADNATEGDCDSTTP